MHDLMMNLLTLPVELPLDVPDPGEGEAPPGFGNFETIMGWGKWLALGVLVLALMAAGAMMGVQSRRGEGGEHAGRILGALFGVMVVAAAFSLVGFLA